MSATVDLSIIIISWNVWNLLRACLRSIEESSMPSGDSHLRTFTVDGRALTLETIVVDNASSDATVSLLASQFPWVRTIASGENLGFGRANNQGFAAGRGRLIYFLNPDTELTRDSLRTLVAALEKSPADGNQKVGIVGPKLHYADGAWQNNRRRFPTRLSGFWESTWLGRTWPQNPWTRRFHMQDWPAETQHDVDWLVGAALLCRREALAEAGEEPFDERFFLYSEETDLCRRVKQAGWRVVYVPNATVIHYEARSSDQVSTARRIYFNTSKVRYAARWFGPRWAEFLRRYLLWEFRFQLALEAAKWLLGHKRNLRASRVQAYRAVLASRLK